MNFVSSLRSILLDDGAIWELVAKFQLKFQEEIVGLEDVLVTPPQSIDLSLRSMGGFSGSGNMSGLGSMTESQKAKGLEDLVLLQAEMIEMAEHERQVLARQLEDTRKEVERLGAIVQQMTVK
ncbi:hypothetical protein Droror1_Dr00017354 [Drosera rotundifolia]